MHSQNDRIAPIVRLSGVSKAFPETGGSVRTAVRDLDLSVPGGLCFGLLGPNGAGKTTCLRMIYGVTRATAGSVEVFGLDVSKHTREVRKRLGVTLQENVLVESLDCIDNLRIFARYHCLEASAIDARIEELLDFLALRSHARVPVEALSGGYKRRLAVAMSLVNRPELLILDEPTTGLDPAVRHTLWSRIRALREGGTTVLLTTHYMDEAERLCDRVAIISHGRVVCEDTPAELIRSHLAAEALELECSAAEEAALLGETRLVRQRLRSEGHLMLFSDDATALADTIRHRDGGDARPLILRPTNLEDVFLAVTGGSLEHGEDDGVGGGA